ncbi:hypothetical protein PG997_013563 [Apiospora hydei]|uniref:Rhodopsin domain-containing protein n=1 Tax=Apiospora hydei TaxID=1337664 RepID=A0ABR1V940_9PEZI
MEQPLDLNEYEPLYPVSDDNHAAYVVVPSLIFFAYAVLAVIAKNVLRFKWTTVKLHDIVLIVSTLLLVAQTACVVLSCNSGLGEPSGQAFQRANTAIQPGRAEDLLFTYSFGTHVWWIPPTTHHYLTFAADLLSLFAQTCAKISVSLLISVISNQAYPWSHKQTVHGINQNHLFDANRFLFSLIILCSVVGVFGLSLQCGLGGVLAEPWSAASLGHCSWGGEVWMFNAVAGVITDLGLCVLPIAMMWKVQTRSTVKATVTILFGSRILVPLIALPSIVQGPQVTNGSNGADVTWLAVNPTVWHQVSINLSVLTACIPSLKSFIDSLTGYTSGLRIMLPYEYPNVSSGSHNHGVRSAIAAVYRGSRPGVNTTLVSSNQGDQHRKRGDGCDTNPRTESTQDLTEGVIHRSDHVSVTFERAPSHYPKYN